MAVSRKRLIGLIGVTALTAGTLLVAPAAQAAVDPDSAVVINEIYGGGGAAGAVVPNDFIELYNTTDAPVDLTGWTVQYKSAAGATWSGSTTLSGSIPANGHYLISEASEISGAEPLPQSDASGNINLSRTAGNVALANGSARLSCVKVACSDDAAVVDLVGFGSGDTPAGSAAPAPSLTTSVSRDAEHTNTANNAADFTAGTPSPQGSGVLPEEPGEPVVKTIAEIQGAGDSSPLVGSAVTTTGVVTAAYPTGGFGGYTIQTPGTGGPLDLAAHTTSDAVFVYAPALLDTARIGDLVQVTGVVEEHFGLTEISASTGGVTVLDADAAPIEPATTSSWPGSVAQRESLESMLYQPLGDFTVTDTYATNQYGEVGLATGTTPLIQPTDVARPGSPEAAAVAADNASRAVVLDDGATLDFLKEPNRNLTPPYLSLTAPVRVGAEVIWNHPVIVDFRNGTWKFNPTEPIVDVDPTATPASFKNNRTNAPDEGNLAHPDRGQPDLKIASFNVLNYFTTLGADVAGCTSFNDREGNPITVDSCPGNGPRGAWNSDNLQRQQDKIVHAINALDADVVGLSEIENSAVVGKPKDAALSTLVDALNVDAGAVVWAFVPSSTELPVVAQMDVITNAIIYKPGAVTRLGNSRALGTQSAGTAPFANAREPIAQVFAPINGSPFLFVMNHFKSKGSAGPLPGDVDSGDGQGASNASRVAQATALRDWISTVRGPAAAVALVGDFNSYGQEDPLEVLYNAGYVNAEKHFELGKSSYSFDGLSGSLDHILINSDALDRATGADIWNVNSPESVALQYSRFNYHGTSFYDPSPFASSDHDPVVLGLKAGGPSAGNQTVQILGINDFHGRIQANTTEAGAAVLSGAVHQLRAQYPSTVFSAAGDLIGASTFESFIQQDKPTLDALNAAGLEVSAVGNHEFDKGYEDLTGRVMAPYDATTNPYGGANWEYLGANVRHSDDGSAALPESWVQNFGSVRVGFVGAVTDHLPELVSPDGIEGLTIEAPVVAANREADRLKAQGADIVVLLVHEGAATASLSSATDPASDFGRIVNGVDPDIDAIVSGHTHLSYNHQIPVQAWIDEGRPVTTRPVVSAGQYGYNLNQLLFTVDPTDKVVGVQSNTLPLVTTTTVGTTTTYTPNYPADPAVTPIVADAVAKAEVLGAAELGKIGGPLNRAKLANGTTENRGGESTLGNLVAEVQRWATSSPTTGSAQIALMNPGGLRADMVGTLGAPQPYPAVLTYKQAANVQPFANTLVNMDLTGAQLKTVLEQQWQPTGAARPFLRLGLSKGFTYTYDPAAAVGSHITRMWLDGAEIVPTQTYSVTVNSFLASGGDNFTELANGAGRQDTGRTDLQAMVDYLAANTPVAVDYTQRSVGVTFPAGSPAEYAPGAAVALTASSLAFSTTPDAKDTELALSLDGVAVGTAAVDNTIGTDTFDEYGTASVSFTVPAGTTKGAHELTLTGNVTGTTSKVTITIAGPPAPTATTTLELSPQSQIYGSSNRVTFTATVTSSDNTPVTGQVEFRHGDLVVATQAISDGKATFRPPATTPVGTYAVTARYLGNGTLPASEPSAPQTVTVQQASSQTVLISTATSFRQGAFLPPIMIAGVGLNNGQLPQGTVQVFVDGQPGPRLGLTLGLALYIPSRSLPQGQHTFTAVFEPSDPANIGGSTSTPVVIQVR